MSIKLSKKTAVLLIGFGGPSRPEEVRPFLESVLKGVRIPQERFDEVLRHYEAIGGVSLYNVSTQWQKDALQKWFEKKQVPLSVGVGFRHSFPSFKDSFEILKKYGVEKVIGFVLSPLRCYSSFEKYMDRVEEGRKEATAQNIEITCTGSFYDHPLFIEAQTKKLEAVLSDLSSGGRKETFVLFSAHSIPVEMSDKSGYASQFRTASALVAGCLGLKTWECAYQSRSGDPSQPWLSPDVKENLASIKKNGFRNVVLVPIGFLCDNVEVKYDLDVEVKNVCEEIGLRYLRAATVADDPLFIEMMGQQIVNAVQKVSA